MLEIMTVGGKAKSREPKYDAFLEYLGRQTASNHDLGTTITPADANAYAKRRVDMAKGTLGTMTGSPWQNGTAAGANTGRVIQHLCPSQAIFELLRSEGRIVMLQLGYGSYGNIAVSLPGVDRNGYASGSTTLAKGVTYVRYETNPSLVYYDSVADELYSMVGSTKAGPTVWKIPQ